ncbi:MAG: hypothetical protein QNK37_11850 [Acidobacteriota bacterium]|nr:hypothetical protein [Acidobacteriota bacterium]
MKHWTLDQFNMMKEGRGTEAERAELVDHLLSCDACAQRFHMMFDLDREMAKKEKHPWRYAVGAAAVIFMASYPYFTTPDRPDAPEPTLHLETAMADNGGLGVLDQVHQVNMNAAIDNWGKETNLEDLLRLQRR